MAPFEVLNWDIYCFSLNIVFGMISFFGVVSSFLLVLCYVLKFFFPSSICYSCDVFKSFFLSILFVLLILFTEYENVFCFVTFFKKSSGYFFVILSDLLVFKEHLLFKNLATISRERHLFRKILRFF